jgi:ferritin heavy chain
MLVSSLALRSSPVYPAASGVGGNTSRRAQVAARASRGKEQRGGESSPVYPAVSGVGGNTSRRAQVAARASRGKEQRGSEKAETVTGLVFEPMKEVQLQLKDQAERGGLNDPTSSLVKMHFSQKAEAAINEQINIEYNISYVYHSMSAYFDRDNVSLPGLAKYFRDQSLEERSHAQKLIDFQNTRGGRVKLLALVPPETEFTEDSRGDALYAMELSVSLERLNYDKLLNLWEVMEAEADAQASHFVEYMLEKQAEDIKETADYVSQLRRVSKGHGVWHFDHELYEKEVHYMADAGGDGAV